jgi:hypothetical protein
VPAAQVPPQAVPPAPDLPAAAGPVLFSTDFSNHNATAWQSSTFDSSDYESLWLAPKGVLRIEGDITLNTHAEEAYYRTGPQTWSNVVLEAAIFSTSGEDAGLIWNAQGASFYRLRLFPNQPNDAPKAVLDLVRNGRATVLAQAAPAVYPGYSPTAWEQVRVQSADGRQQVWVNKALVLDVRDGTLTAGQVGLYAWASSGARFDNVRVQSAGVSR